jgi:hypothetical protein
MPQLYTPALEAAGLYDQYKTGEMCISEHAYAGDPTAKRITENPDLLYTIQEIMPHVDMLAGKKPHQVAGLQDYASEAEIRVVYEATLPKHAPSEQQAKINHAAMLLLPENSPLRSDVEAMQDAIAKELKVLQRYGTAAQTHTAGLSKAGASPHSI